MRTRYSLPVLVLVCERTILKNTAHTKKIGTHGHIHKWPGLGNFAPPRQGSSYADVQTQSVTHPSTFNGGARIPRTYRSAGLTFTCLKRCGKQQSEGHNVAGARSPPPFFIDRWGPNINAKKLANKNTVPTLPLLAFASRRPRPFYSRPARGNLFSSR